MNKITSVSNEKIKNLIKLKQKKFRQEIDAVLIEGYKIFLEAIKTNQQIIEIFLTEKEAKKIKLNGYEKNHDINK